MKKTLALVFVFVFVLGFMSGHATRHSQLDTHIPENTTQDLEQELDILRYATSELIQNGHEMKVIIMTYDDVNTAQAKKILKQEQTILNQEQTIHETSAVNDVLQLR